MAVAIAPASTMAPQCGQNGVGSASNFPQDGQVAPDKWRYFTLGGRFRLRDASEESGRHEPVEHRNQVADSERVLQHGQRLARACQIHKMRHEKRTANLLFMASAGFGLFLRTDLAMVSKEITLFFTSFMLKALVKSDPVSPQLADYLRPGAICQR